MAPPGPAPADQATAQTILTSLLITSTHFLVPSLPALRALLNNTSPALSAETTDATLKAYLREITEDRKAVRGGVEKKIASFKLLSKNAKRARVGAVGEDSDHEGVEVDELDLQAAAEKLEAEERMLEVELGELDQAIEGSKRGLDACVPSSESCGPGANPLDTQICRRTREHGAPRAPCRSFCSASSQRHSARSRGGLPGARLAVPEGRLADKLSLQRYDGKIRDINSYAAGN